MFFLHTAIIRNSLLRRGYTILILVFFPLLCLNSAEKLTGRVIGTAISVDYSDFSQSTTVNTREMAFDGDLNTCFASYDRSYGWCGLDLGATYVITRVGWSPRNDGLGPGRMVLGVFEGSNREDFMDALPLYMITQSGEIGRMNYADVNVSRGFRYVRYVGPSDARCNVAEIEFYGYKAAGDDSRLYQITNLPTVSIHTQANQEPYDKEHQIISNISIISNDGKSLLSATGGTRLRGNASIQFPKKPYRIKFDSKQQVLNSPAKAKKWVLINNYGDKTLMRNMIAFSYSKRMQMAYTPFCQPVDVLLNGEYKGTYQIADQLDVRKERVNITEMKTTDNSGVQLTGGYFIEIDGYAYEEPENIRFYSSRLGMGVTIHSPDQDSIIPAQKTYIEQFYNEMEYRTFASTFTDPKLGWRSRLDEDSWIKHFLIGELTGNTDTYWSCHLYKQRGEDKFYAGPEWDFDIAFDNDYRQYPTCNKSDYLYVSAGTYKEFVSRTIKQDAGTQASILRLWDMARGKGGITEDAICAEIDSIADVIRESATLNFMRWNILNENVHMNPRHAGSFQGEVEWLKEYVRKRIQWMDKKIGYTYTPYVPDGMEEIKSDAHASIDFEKPYSVYNTMGMPMGTSVADLPQGIYIIRQGSEAMKIFL